MNRYHQLQSWPTPVIFESVDRGPRFVKEDSNAALVLSEFTNFIPLLRSVADDGGAKVDATGFVVWGPQPRGATEPTPATAALSATSFVYIAPLQRSTTESPSSAALSLPSFIQQTVIPRTPAETPATAALSCSSFVKV